MINADALQDQSTFDTGRLCAVQAKRSIQGCTGRGYGSSMQTCEYDRSAMLWAHR
jgi:hypothetical protein